MWFCDGEKGGVLDVSRVHDKQWSREVIKSTQPGCGKEEGDGRILIAMDTQGGFMSQQCIYKCIFNCVLKTVC